MDISNYFKNISNKLNQDSDEIREFFGSHKPSAGSNREGLIAELLSKHLPNRYGVSHGLIYSNEGEFSNQADIIISDSLNNSPLFSNRVEPIWLVEAVYSLIEVKTTLSPTTIDDCLKKCKRFKGLVRNPSDRELERIKESLFAVWSFEGPSHDTFKDIIVEKICSVNIDERPDLIIVPGRYVVISGQYQEIARLGQTGSSHRAKIEQEPDYRTKYLHRGFELHVLNEHSLFAFMVWLSSWLHQAGERHAPLGTYIPKTLNSESDNKFIT